MGKKRKTASSAQPVDYHHLATRLREGLFVFVIAVALYLGISLATYHGQTALWSDATYSTEPIHNAGGRVGAWLAETALHWFGYMAYPLPLFWLYGAWLVFRQRKDKPQRTWAHQLYHTLRSVSVVVFLLSTCALLTLHVPAQLSFMPLSGGGLIGEWVGDHLLRIFNLTGATLILSALFLIAITFYAGVSWLTLLGNVNRAALWSLKTLGRVLWCGLRLSVNGLRRVGTYLARPWVAVGRAAWRGVKRLLTWRPRPIQRRPHKPVSVEETDRHIATHGIRPYANSTGTTTKTNTTANIATNTITDTSSVVSVTGMMNASAADAVASEFDADAIAADVAAQFNTDAGSRSNLASPAGADSIIMGSGSTVVDKMSSEGASVSSMGGVSSPSKKNNIDKKSLKSPPIPHTLPTLTLLDTPKGKSSNQLSEAEKRERCGLLETKLADFGVQVKVVAVYPGPVVTRYELELAAGTKVSKITGLAKDLARSLSVISVRVVEVIPGKSVIGIELPNPHREVVFLQQVLASDTYRSKSSALTMALGKDIAGHSMTADLAKMPHLLVAGTTGSGKSVCLNAILLSFLYKSSPEALRLILIDPKMLELSVYDDIPHLLTPVVTDMKDAATALRWCVAEMERRYRLMASLGVRNIHGFNQKVNQAIARGRPIADPFQVSDGDDEPAVLTAIPQIVVIADEYADMMVVVGKKIETLIARLAQKARAAGIHLILATQRPSVDVITGLIKANIPCRIAFQVSSKVDSRTILDQQGAEQLLGQGDMLYLPPGSGVPIRVHGAYVSDDEVHRVVQSLKKSGSPDYIDAVVDERMSTPIPGLGRENGESGDAEQDELYDEAVKFVVKMRKASISSVQRRFKIGYNRAARIVDAMEAAGVVGSMESGGARDVLVPDHETDD